MTPERWQQVDKIFQAVIELNAVERAAFLDASCAGDERLRSEVESLISSDEQGLSLIDDPAFEVAAGLIVSPQPELTGGQRIGHYEIEGLIGRGGMGEVYVAQDERLKRRIALKFLPADYTRDKSRLRRFQQEAQAASALNHPNILTIHELGEVDGQQFIATEFVDGETLRQRLRRDKLNLSEALDIAIQIASALSAAHQAEIVHRDIKPENIMLRPDGYVKVLDFGLAKLSGQRERNPDALDADDVDTSSGLLLGTVKYMSPEQARGHDVDRRTDIWSWGIVFYEMLIGAPPFTGATSRDVIADILNHEPPLLSDESESVFRPATVILRKALSKEKNNRYSSTTELLRDLHELRSRLQKAEEGLRPIDLPETSANHPQLSEADKTDGSPAASTAAGFSPHKASRLRSMMFVGGIGLCAIVLAFIVYRIVARQPAQQTRAVGPPQITRLTNDGRILDAAISVDGRFLAYVPIEAGKHSLWIQNLQSGEKRQLIPPDSALFFGMRFTPNGQSILYIVKQVDSTIGVLYRIPVTGGPSLKLVVNVDTPPAVSPDGTRLAFIRGYPGQRRDALMIANVDGSAESEIASRQHPARFSFSGPSWSPDGKMIAVGSRDNDHGFALLTVSIDGGAEVELTPPDWVAVRGVAWERDGRSLFFCGRSKGARSMQIWRLYYPDGAAEPITSDGRQYEEVTLAHNIMVATDTYEESNIWTASEMEGSRQVTNDGHEGADGLAVTSSGRIVYTEGEHEQSHLWGMNLDGTDRKQLTEHTGFLPAASVDGRFIAYVSAQTGIYNIWVMDSDGRNGRQLTNGGGENFPSLTPDGNWVVYNSLASPRNTLWKISTAGGQPIQLTHTGMTIRPVVSPDGATIACTYRLDETDNWKIALLPIQGGHPLKTFPLPSPVGQVIRWTLDGEALLYLDKRDGATNIWRQPLDGSAPTKLTAFSEDAILFYDLRYKEPGFVVSRGGRRRDIAMIKDFE